ncbi:MAG: hypothetical protein HZA91_16280 [Verrucomicrobia bacterium]|nr:hypothetical protein [Verrucomicrobiota bacterium]
MILRLASLGLAACVAAGVVSAQTIEEIRQRMGVGGGAGAAGRGTDTPLVEVPWEKIGDKKLFKDGEIAMGKDPNAWRHAETPHFVLHYHKIIDARKVARQAEFYYQQIKSDLQVTEDRYDRKNHIFIFEKAEEWKDFRAQTDAEEWAASFACRSEVFFQSRERDGDFAANTLAHEITHTIFYRFVPHRVPTWLNEGFAEFESGNAYAKFKGIGGGAHANVRHSAASFPIKTLVAMKGYPEDKKDVNEFYASSARLVRFLINKLDRKRFLPLVQKIVEGAKFEEAVLAVYPDKFKTFADFERAHEKAGI